MILKQLIKYDNAPCLEATWVDKDDVVIKCHAYSNGQMDMLRADLGADAAQYESLIAEVEATYSPSPPQPIPVPQQVTMRQARLELLSRGLLDNVAATIAVAGRAAQIEWEYASTVDRDNPVIAAVQQRQHMTDEQIDDLFREAAKR